MLPMAGEVRSKWEVTVTSKCFIERKIKCCRYDGGILPVAKRKF